MEYDRGLSADPGRNGITMVFPDPDGSNQAFAAAGTKLPKTHIVPASHGFAFTVEKGEHFRVVDLYGEQVVDFAAWVQGTDLVEKLSMAYTRYHLDGVTPAIGEYLWTNKDEPILQIVDDTVKVHDMTVSIHHLIVHWKTIRAGCGWSISPKNLLEPLLGGV